MKKTLQILLVLTYILINISCNKDEDDNSSTNPNNNNNPPPGATYYFKAKVNGSNVYFDYDVSGAYSISHSENSTYAYHCGILATDNRIASFVIGNQIVIGGGFPTPDAFFNYFKPGNYSFSEVPIESEMNDTKVEFHYGKDDEDDDDAYLNNYSSTFGSGNQTGSSFQIVDTTHIIKSHQTETYAIKMKVKFNCNLYKKSDGSKITVTDGEMVTTVFRY